ncbi:Rho GTPase-activating protein 22 [Lunasporangiospora selenospora]|uniref:Rho GTPase-activating protein 22 n=1 Tax=Lunasporangiospora selenospora TaxID=979761 RepID=A0A9P6FRT8_9FUNG|nr:Rho GTPase-activating protein 22 [Lunasporangiospora selenospora]
MLQAQPGPSASNIPTASGESGFTETDRLWGNSYSTLGDHVMLQEWLQKRSTSLQLVWKRRWCVLRDDKLYYFRSNTDSKPLGVLHLAEYSILTAGPDISRKSKYTFRLSSAEPIPHQHQHHLFHAESIQSLQNWLFAIQTHINHARAPWATTGSSMTGLGLQMGEGNTGGPVGNGEQSIIDKVLDRLQIDDQASADSSMTVSGNGGIGHVSLGDSATATMPSPTMVSTSGTFSSHYLSTLPRNFPKSHEDNNDTWSSTSSIPNSSTNTSTNLEYIFTVNQHHPTPLSHQQQSSQTQQQSQTKYSMDSPRDSQQHGHAIYGHGSHASSPPPSIGSPRIYPTTRSSIHSGKSMDNIGGMSPATSIAESPFSSPTLSSQTHSTFHSNNIVANISGASGSNIVPASPRPFYKVLESSPGHRRAESIASSTSISTIASSGDVSTINDLNSENGVTGQSTEVSSSSAQGSKTNGLLSIMTGGRHRKDKEKSKDKERNGHSSAGSSHSGNGGGGSSPAIKFFTAGACLYSGCPNQAKSCTLHNKKYRQLLCGGSKSGSGAGGSNGSSGEKEPKDGGNKKSRNFWSSTLDKSSRQNQVDQLSVNTLAPPPSQSLTSSRSDESLSPSIGDSTTLKSGRGLSSKSMTSLSHENEFSIDAPIPKPSSHLLSLVSSPTRQRSPSVSVVDDAILAAQQEHLLQQQHQSRFYSDLIQPITTGPHPTRSQTPPPGHFSAAPTVQPPRAVSSASVRPHGNSISNGSGSLKNSNSLKRTGLPSGSEFGVPSPTTTTDFDVSSALGSGLFVANHHRTMQKLQAQGTQLKKSLSGGPLPPPPPPPPGKAWSPHQQQQQPSIHQQQQLSHYPQQPQQYSLYNGGVSRHIVAPEELAMAIEQEAQEMRRRQEKDKEVQKSRPTSMIKSSFHSVPLHFPAHLASNLATVSEMPNPIPEGNESAQGSYSQVSSPPSEGNYFQDGGRIISSREQQLACAETPLEGETPETTQRSPISGIIICTPTVTPMPLPPAIMDLSVSGSDSTSKAPSTVSFPASAATTRGNGFVASTPLSRLNDSTVPHPNQPLQPLSPLSSFLMDKSSEYPFQSLLPPKRPGNAPERSTIKGLPGMYSSPLATGSGSSAAGTRAEGTPLADGSIRYRVPRRSSAAAAVSLSSSPSNEFVRRGSYGQVANAGSSTSSSSLIAPPGPLRPGYLTRRQSSSPVLIRLSDQGGQDISPLLTGGATRVFAGVAPSKEVQRHGLPPVESLSASSSSTASPATTSCSSHCSGTDQSRTFEGDSGVESGSEVASQCVSMISSPNIEEGTNTLAADKGDSMDNNASSSTVSQQQQNPRKMLEPQMSFVFPSRSMSNTMGATQSNMGSTLRPGAGTGSGNGVLLQRPLSSYSSHDSSGGEDEEEVDGDGLSTPGNQSSHSSREASPMLSPSMHAAAAAALEMYSGLRKLSLFTAHVGTQPPPPLLLERRKGSGGSGVSTLGSSHLRDAYTPSSGNRTVQEDDVDEDEGEYESEYSERGVLHDEDWAVELRQRIRTRREQESRVQEQGEEGAYSHEGSQPQTPAPTSLSAVTRVSEPLSALKSSPLPSLPPSLASSPTAGTASPTPQHIPPAIPPRSPHRGGPLSPTTLRPQRSMPQLHPLSQVQTQPQQRQL